MTLPSPAVIDWKARFAPLVAIIGAGFSGTMLAINLLAHSGVRVLLIETHSDRFARGVAYGARHASHILNVRASNMSAFAEHPDDFATWLAADQDGDPPVFASRSDYGRYLACRLEEARAHHPDRLQLIEDQVLDVAPYEGKMTLGLKSGALLTVDRVVLAVGNLPPHDPPGVEAAQLSTAHYVRDPWATDEWSLDPMVPVMALGTGLTAIDAILRLDDSGFAGPIIALSRRGLRPHSHVVEQAKPTPQLAKPAETLSGMVRWSRLQSGTQDWRATVDSLRPITQLMWCGADQDMRARFLRHLRPWWDIHRHRIAPEVGARIDRLVAEKRLRFVAGKVAAISSADAMLEVSWRPRGTGAITTTKVQRLINCTGPQGDLLRTADPMLRNLMASGRIRPEALRLGLDVDRECRVIGAEGRTSDQLLAVGPITRGEYWEIVAVPDIRMQVAALARRLTQAHWVGGEGL